MGRALVLGGGGVAGVSWTIGLLAGMQRAGTFSIDDVDVIVGTSAGSVIGSRLLSGQSLDAMVEQELGAPRAPSGDRFGRLDLDLVGKVFETWAAPEVMTPERAARIGAWAIDAAPRPPERHLAHIAERLDGATWSERMIVTGVDCASGHRVAWRAADGVDLVHAVACSTAVPSLTPPITIGDRTFMDGGVWSLTNGDLIAGADVDQVLIVGPQAGGGILAPFSKASIERDRALLSRAGMQVTAVIPGPAYAEIGENPMHPKWRAPAVDIGLADAASLS